MKNLRQKIQIWELACRKKVEVEKIAYGKNVDWEGNIREGDSNNLSFSHSLFSEFTVVLASWLSWLCESWNLSLMINIHTRILNQADELLKNSCNVILTLTALINSTVIKGLRVRVAFVQRPYYTTQFEIYKWKSQLKVNHKNDTYLTPKFYFNKIFI